MNADVSGHARECGDITMNASTSGARPVEAEVPR